MEGLLTKGPTWHQWTDKLIKVQPNKRPTNRLTNRVTDWPRNGPTHWGINETSDQTTEGVTSWPRNQRSNWGINRETKVLMKWRGINQHKDWLTEVRPTNIQSEQWIYRLKDWPINGQTNRGTDQQRDRPTKEGTNKNQYIMNISTKRSTNQRTDQQAGDQPRHEQTDQLRGQPTDWEMINQGTNHEPTIPMNTNKPTKGLSDWGINQPRDRRTNAPPNWPRNQPIYKLSQRDKLPNRQTNQCTNM